LQDWNASSREESLGSAPVGEADKALCLWADYFPYLADFFFFFSLFIIIMTLGHVVLKKKKS